jgi:hypothetical protein
MRKTRIPGAGGAMRKSEVGSRNAKTNRDFPCVFRLRVADFFPAAWHNLTDLALVIAVNVWEN